MVWRSTRARNLLNSSSAPSGQLIIDNGYNSSEQESSEGEFVEAEKPWPPVELSRSSRERTKVAAALHAPRPHSHLFRRPDGRSRGSKHSRRWENSMFLSSLHQIPEEELEVSNILPDHSSPLTQLHSSDKCMQIWCSFTSRSEEEQERIVSSRRWIHNTNSNSSPPSSIPAVSEAKMVAATKEEEDRLQEQATAAEGGEKKEELEGENPERCFRKVDRRIRSVLQHNKHLPSGLLLDLEEELRYYFSIDRGAVVIALQTNPFYRLLLHGICQYMGLHSSTEQYGSASLLVAECPTNQFSPPTTTLSHFLQHRK